MQSNFISHKQQSFPKKGSTKLNKLILLQQGLKKQFLFIQKQQQQKVKLKRQIEQSIKTYNTLLIESLNKSNLIAKDDGFENCYNFIKDVIIGISQNIDIGHYLIYCLDDNSSVLKLLAHMFYQNIQTIDYYFKDISILIHKIILDLFQPDLPEKNKQKVLKFIQLYFDRQENNNYFKTVSYQTIKELIDSVNKEKKLSSEIEDKKKLLLLNQFEVLDDKNHQKEIRIPQSVGKNVDYPQIIKRFLQKIELEASAIPLGIKILLRSGFKKIGYDKRTEFHQLWALISYFYLKPFKQALKNKYIATDQQAKISLFIQDLVNNYGFQNQLNYEYINTPNKVEQKIESTKIQKIVSQLILLNDEKYSQYILLHEKGSPNEIQIKIYGACLNYNQLKEILFTIQQYKSEISKINQKIVNRTLKIFQISPNLEFMKQKSTNNSVSQNLNQLFVSIFELKYEQSIESDYYKNYTLMYKNQSEKNILKQILVEIDYLGHYSYRTNFQKIKRNQRDIQLSVLTKKNTNEKVFEVIETFEHIISENQRQQLIEFKNMPKEYSNNLSPQLQMKIKYFIWLAKKRGKDANIECNTMIQQMTADLLNRQQNNMKLYEDTKFSLLKVYCNIKNSKNYLKSQKQYQKKSQFKIRLIQTLNKIKINLCITSRSTRNRLNFQNEQSLETIDKYRYRMANSDQIIIKNVSQCLHKQNPFIGLKNHASSVIRFIQLFSQLQQVHYFLSNPYYLAKIDNQSYFTYLNQNKIRESFFKFIDDVLNWIKQIDQRLFDQICSSQINRQVLNSLLMRQLSQLLISNQQQQNSIFNSNNLSRYDQKDKKLEQNLMQIYHAQLFSSSKEITPRKNTCESFISDSSRNSYESSNKQIPQKISSTHNINIIQLIEIGARYIKSLNNVKTPNQKIKKLKQIVDIYTTILKKYPQNELHTIQWMIYKSIIKARPKNFIKNLTFIEMFLNEEKLLSTDGKILQLFKKVVANIFEMKIEIYMQNDIGEDYKKQNGFKTIYEEIITEGKVNRQLQIIKSKKKQY